MTENLNPTFQFGTIRTNVQGGQITVAKQLDLDMNSLNFEVDADLNDATIRVMEASSKYNIPHNTLVQWADRGMIAIVERAPKLLVLNEADVARAVAVFKFAKKYYDGSSLKAGWFLKRFLAA